MGRISSSAEIELIAGDTFSSTSTGTTTINSGTGAMNISTDAAATTVAVGVVASVKTITIGSVTGSSSMTIDGGTGAFSVGISIAKTLTIGNTTGATAVNMNIGTGDFTMASGSGTLVSQLDTGQMTKPLQTAFLAYLATDANNVTGNAANFTLGTGTAFTEVFDQGNDFNTNGTFTAPVDGVYLFSVGIKVLQVTAAMNSCLITLNTANDYQFGVFSPGAIRDSTDSVTFNGTLIVSLIAGETVTCVIRISGGAGNTADIDGDANAYTFFSGCKLA
jgi:hypothetical protein